MRTMDASAQVMLILGGLVWLFFGLTKGQSFLSAMDSTTRAVLGAYSLLIGLAAIWQAFRYYTQFIDRRSFSREPPPSR